MSKHILITGGAGFIGSHLADELLRNDCRVTVLDNLSPQVHGDLDEAPEYLSDDVRLVIGDVRDPDVVRRELEGIDVVYHLAAAVGVGQSMYEIEHYVSTNDVGTAVLLEALCENPVERLIVASSMSIYGEGLYRSASGHTVESQARSRQALENEEWELLDEEGRPLKPKPTPETKSPDLSSVYALSKYNQERLSLMVGEAYEIPTVALRFFNAYGPRQALSNPYTGVLAIFAARYLNEKSPIIYEDGAQRRDFVNVADVARACRLAMEVDEAAYQVFNVGSGESVSIGEIATMMARVLGKEEIQAQITGEYRVGDIRHCFADISKAQKVLGFEPQISLKEGMEELAEWLEGKRADDRVSSAQNELSQRGLTLGNQQRGAQ